MTSLKLIGEIEFPFSKGNVFDAAISTIQNVEGLRLNNFNKATGRIDASEGVSLTVTGANILIQLHELSDRKTKVQITSSLKGSGEDGTKRNKNNIEQIIFGIANNIEHSMDESNADFDRYIHETIVYAESEKVESINQENFPPLIQRIKSVMIDNGFILICFAVLSQLFSNESNGVLKGFLLFALLFLYEPICMSFGCTIGNYLSGIRVRKFGKEEGHINIFQSYVRFIVKILLGIISFFTVTFDDSKRAIHDMAAGSVVVSAKTK